MKLPLILLCLSLPSFAQVRVLPVKPGLKLPEGNYVRESEQKSTLFSREDREKFFSRFPDSQTVIAKMDELDRDFFFDDLRRLPASELQTKYPSVKGELLRKMSAERKK